jgi:3-isopropylmalate/(R)-2-methylmalate dehydratase small subunit
MERFTAIESVVVPLSQQNIDTDQILPARFLHKPRSGGYGNYLFHDLRFRADGTPNPDFVLNEPRYDDAKILVARRNFACGSSRENAVWALYDYGFRVALAPSFGDIFFSNSIKNGLLPIVLPDDVIDGLFADLKRFPDARVGIDLAEQTVGLPGGIHRAFEIDAFAKHCFLNGLDELDYTLTRMDEIVAFEKRHKAEIDNELPRAGAHS